MQTDLIKFEAGPYSGDISGLVTIPKKPLAAFVFAHGAGAGMRHPFMTGIAEGLSEKGVAVLRYQFPYMEKGSRRPDQRPELIAAVRAAISQANDLFPDIPLFAGGKSMGGRMTSNAYADALLPNVLGLVFFGFPLHPAGKPSVERAEHLKHVSVPMLFLQGTADKLADLNLLRPVCSGLGMLAELYEFEKADHSFHVPKSSGSNDPEILKRLIGTSADWMLRHISGK